MNSEKKNNINFVDVSKKNNDIEEIKNVLNKFKILKSKRGRKIKNDNKNESPKSKTNLESKIHSKYRNDNIRNKIFTHFIFFVISFLNDYGKQFIHQKIFFKGITYKFRQKLNFQKIQNIMSCTIKDFCNIPVSSKYKNCENLNLKSFNLLSKFFDEEFVNMKICNLYKYCYYKNNFKLIKTYFGLSDKIENFEKLLEKYNNDIEYRNKLKINGKNLLKFCIEDSFFLFYYDIRVEKNNNFQVLKFEDNSILSSNYILSNKEDSSNEI